MASLLTEEAVEVVVDLAEEEPEVAVEEVVAEEVGEEGVDLQLKSLLLIWMLRWIAT
jgi:hypothetical protein